MDSKSLDKQKLKEFCKHEIVLIVSVVLAIASSFINGPNFGSISYKDLMLLFDLMIVVTALKEFKVLDYIGTKLLHKDNSSRRIYIIMVTLTFFSSMLITDDVALITFVPLALVLAKKANFNPVKLVVFQTMAAILGCALTPMGSSQNLYIFTHFDLTSGEFFAVTLPMAIVAFIFLLVLVLVQKNKKLDVAIEEIHIKHKKLTILYFVLFLVVLASVFKLLNYEYAFIIILVVTFFVNKKLFKRVDYSLLITFTGFFIFIGNVSAIPAVKTLVSGLLTDPIHTYFISLILSQFISNVPVTLLLSPFTHDFKSIVLGVNAGGLFSLIGSMASIISYKFVISETKTSPITYIKMFAFYSLIAFCVIIPTAMVLIIFF